MKQITLRILIAILCFASTNQAISASKSDEDRDYAMARRHDSDVMFFEQIENGVAARFIALKFNANEEKDGSKWAECTYAEIQIDKDQKRSGLTFRHFSTTEDTIKDLTVSPKSISFAVDLGYLEQGGNTRQIKFVASRKGSSSNIYEGNAIALWKDIFDETKRIKIEWKQVPSITLPYPLMNLYP